MLSYNDTTEKPSPERSRAEASFPSVYIIILIVVIFIICKQIRHEFSLEVA